MVTIVRQLLAASLFTALTPPALLAKSSTYQDVFESEAAALDFATLLGPGWAEPFNRRFCCESDGLRFTRYLYRMGGRTGFVQIGVDVQGHLRRYEVKFPIVDNVCLRAPDTRMLAQLLLNHTEPTFASNRRNINLVGSSADLVWTWTAFPSGPGVQFGKTQYYFRKMSGYCTLDLRRLEL